jgi:hypothetical protein
VTTTFGIPLGKDRAVAGVTVGGRELDDPRGYFDAHNRSPPRKLRVAGTFSLGLYEFDTTMGFTSLDAAKRRLKKDEPDMIQRRVDDRYAAPAIAHGIDDGFEGHYTTQDWADINQPLFSALWLEKIAVSLAIGLIVMGAALNIIASLILLVMEKSRDIAILKTMGASESVTTIFIRRGDHRIDWNRGRRRARIHPGESVRPLPTDQGAGGCLPGLAPAVHGAALGPAAGDFDCDADLFSRDDLSLAAGREARSGAGAAL